MKQLVDPVSHDLHFCIIQVDPKQMSLILAKLLLNKSSHKSRFINTHAQTNLKNRVQKNVPELIHVAVHVRLWKHFFPSRPVGERANNAVAMPPPANFLPELFAAPSLAL